MKSGSMKSDSSDAAVPAPFKTYTPEQGCTFVGNMPDYFDRRLATVLLQDRQPDNVDLDLLVWHCFENLLLHHTGTVFARPSRR